MTAPRFTRRTFALAAPALALSGLAVPARARPLARPVVLELFTSEGCSSCPPADALLHRLANSGATLLPLAYHVTYWNYLGWRDPWSLEAATRRQRDYAARRGAGSLYTPQLIVDGRADVVGSDEPAVLRAIRDAAAAMPPPPPLRLAERADAGPGRTVVVELGAAAGLPAGLVLLVGYDREHRTAVGRGENGGRTLLEANIVRSLVPLGSWNGAALRLERPRPAGERLAVLVQAADGRMLAAATGAGGAGARAGAAVGL